MFVLVSKFSPADPLDIAPQLNTCLQKAERDLGQEYEAVLLEKAPRDPRVHGEAEASPQVLDALGLVVKRRLAREYGLEEEPAVPKPVTVVGMRARFVSCAPTLKNLPHMGLVRETVASVFEPLAVAPLGLFA